MINSMWKRYKLSDIGTIVGGATPSTTEERYYGGEIPWLTPKDLSSFNDRYIARGERCITEDGLKSCSAQLLPTGSVLFSSRAPIGYVAIAKNPIATNQGFKSIIPNKDTNSLFLYYLLKYNKANIESMGSGTTFKEVSGATMKNIEVNVPPIEIQQRIARILGALDDKIELNNRISRNLEEQAQALFRRWFVDFEFPDHNGNPYRTSGGEMIDSTLGEIPKDWKVGTLGDIAEIIMGQSPSGTSYNEEGNGEVFYQGRAEFGDRFPTRRLFTTEPNRMAEENSILMSVRAPVGDINIAYEKCCIERGLASIKAKNNFNSFVLYTMHSLKDSLDVFNGEGTVFGSINKDSLREMKIITPNNEFVAKFELIVSAIDGLIKTNFFENQAFATIRDTLLPKLMNNEIKV